MSPTTRDRLGSVLMLAFVAALWSQRDYSSPFGGLFPDTIMIIMAAFIALTLILSFTRYAAMPATPEEGAPAGRSGAFRVAVVIGLLALWVWLFRPAGFFLTGIAGFAGIAWFLGERRADIKVLLQVILMGAAVSFIIYLVFDYFLLVPLPPGFLLD